MQYSITTFKLLQERRLLELSPAAFLVKISQEAKKNGKGLQGEQSGLFFPFIELCREVKPDWIIIENVSTLINKGLETVLYEIAKIGYNAEWQDIQARWFGYLHKRERLFIIAYPDNRRSKGVQFFTGEFFKVITEKKRQATQANNFVEILQTAIKHNCTDLYHSYGLSKRLSKEDVQGIIKLTGNAWIYDVALTIFQRLIQIENE